MPTRSRRSGPERRAAMGTQTSPERASRGRTVTSATPVVIRRVDASVTPLDRNWVQQRLGYHFGKFGHAIDGIVIRMRDESGPKGRPTVEATLELAVPGVGPIVAKGVAENGALALAQAMVAGERTLRRRRERTRGRRYAGTASSRP